MNDFIETNDGMVRLESIQSCTNGWVTLADGSEHRLSAAGITSFLNLQGQLVLPAHPDDRALVIKYKLVNGHRILKDVASVRVLAWLCYPNRDDGMPRPVTAIEGDYETDDDGQETYAYSREFKTLHRSGMVFRDIDHVFGSFKINETTKRKGRDQFKEVGL